MKNVWPVILMVFLCAAGVYSQTAKPTPPEDNDVVKVSTNLIQIDVTITDAKGKAISDLRPDEVEIFENGEKQKITNFSFVSNAPSTISASTPVDKKTLSLAPPKILRRENVKRTIALVVDDLTLSHPDTFFTKEALKKFVNQQMQEGDLVAIIRTGSGIGALQQFTGDKRILLAAIDKLHFNMIAGSRGGAFNPIESTLAEEVNSSGKNLGRTIQSERESQNEINEFRESIYSTGTLGAINYVVRGMKELPGRKSLMLLSAGFKLITRGPNGMSEPSRILDSVKRLVDFANRSSVVIYSIDVRGVTFDGLTAADDTSGLTADQLEGRLSDRQNETIDTQDGLRYLARETGGFAYFQNGISNGIRKALDDHSYYLVGFEPDAATFDPKRNRFNKIEVRVQRPEVKVRYRSGFFGFSEERIANPKRSPDQAIYDALTSPFAVNDISLRLNTLFLADQKKNGYLRSFLHIGAKDLTFVRQPDGKYKTSFDLIASTFGDSGQMQDGMRNTYTLTSTEESYRKLLERGMVYDFEIKLKKAGAYQLRVAIRDNATARVGSASQFIDAPNIKSKKLNLSGILLQNMQYSDWRRYETLSAEKIKELMNPMADTAIRQFRTGTVLSYSSVIYNAKPDVAGKLDLTTQARIYSDQNLVFEGKPFQGNYILADTGGELAAKGTIRLAADLQVGNYTLQVIVTDNNAREGRRVTSQFVYFEIVK